MALVRVVYDTVFLPDFYLTVIGENDLNEISEVVKVCLCDPNIIFRVAGATARDLQFTSLLSINSVVKHNV